MIFIRPANISDAETIAQFNTDMAYETEHMELEPDTILNGVTSLLADPQKGQYYIAVVDEQTVGQAAVTYEWSDWRNGLWWWIQSVYIHPKYRKQGIFRALHNHIADEAKKAGAIGLRLYVERENTIAQKTYTNMGMLQCQYCMFEQKF